MTPTSISSGGKLRIRFVPLLMVLALLLGACGSGDGGKKIQWIEGTAPANLAAQSTVESGNDVEEEPTSTVNQEGEGDADIKPTATLAPAEPTKKPTERPEAVSGVRLSAEQLDEFQPNELGVIPVLEYHTITTEKREEQFVRTVDDFKADLDWLYENDFYVVPLKDLIANRIAAPAGKRPVVLTFDDSTAGQFRYLIADDGSVEIDPDSAIGIMEAFYADHPDFGRGGFFAVLPTVNFCFAWQFADAEPDQYPYCQQKLTWLMDNGYEVGNHTLNHVDLLQQDDDTFRAELAGAIVAFQEMDTRIEANILAMPFGNYPDLDTKQQQREWLREGFEWKGTTYRIIGSLMVGDNPTESPVSTEYDPVFIARIQAFDDDANLEGGRGSAYWFAIFEDDPGQLYVSDGSAETISVPEELPAIMEGTLNTDRIEADGLELIRY